MISRRYGSSVLYRNTTVSNISLFDRPNLELLFGSTVFPDGSGVDIDYAMRVQEICGEFFSKGDPNDNLPYRFPVVTVNASIDEDRNISDREFMKFVARTNREKGCYNIYANEGSKVAMCCRFVNDSKRMNYRTDSFGNGGMNIGSHRVVTINFPRLAIISTTREEFNTNLKETAELVRDLLIVHREEILKRRIEQGYLKFFKPLGWFTLDMFFSTIGLTGLYEMCAFAGLPIEGDEGKQFMREVLETVDGYALKFSEETGFSFNTEEIPGESTTVNFAKKDALEYGKELQPFELYSNQYIPLIADIDMLDRIKLSGEFMNLVSGGGILHMNIAEKIDSDEKMLKLIEIALKAGVPHFAVNYGFGTCKNGHNTIVGNGEICPICMAEIVDYLTRVIGYFTKVSSWNSTRKDYEFPRRKFK